MSNETRQVKTLSISFNLPLYASEIPQWRGAFIEMGAFGNDLFHNHNNAPDNTYSKYHYRYPLIQYRLQQGKAAIFAIGAGVQALQKVLATSDWVVTWKGRKRHLQIEDLRTSTFDLEVTNQVQHYKLYDWVALNEENYEKWQSCTNLLQRVTLLEGLLNNHLMSFCYGIDWKPKKQLEVALQNIESTQNIRLYDSKLLAFTVDFTTKLQLPHYIGIGKAVAQGFGKVRPIWEHNRNHSQPFLEKEQQGQWKDSNV